MHYSWTFSASRELSTAGSSPLSHLWPNVARPMPKILPTSSRLFFDPSRSLGGAKLSHVAPAWTVTLHCGLWMSTIERKHHVLVSPAIDHDGLRKRVVCDVTFSSLLSSPVSIFASMIFERTFTINCGFGHGYVIPWIPTRWSTVLKYIYQSC